ncbi:hypothetical protein UCREL1_8218 [Eutypa lata UCREL1]|uniref:Clr5 domain-containing protein n=1 Tax=Eutypa lata (strain UCR-EL1) TaxID=1287681 RepID=M7T4S5_EUTLA|nr:hypothetical protein UCREL1_8218 [Eutypa lata UCREL1]
MTKQWEQYEATIRALYADHTLATVRQIMIERHGFNASVRAYRGRLDRWNVRKYNRRNRNGSDPHQSSLGGQVSAASATAAATTTITNPVVTSSPPFYGNFVPVTQPLSSWPSDSTSVFAANHPETDGTYGFGHHHDQRLGSTGHLEMPFSADMHNSPPSSGSGAQDARYHGAAGDDAQGYEATPQDLPGRGGSH